MCHTFKPKTTEVKEEIAPFIEKLINEMTIRCGGSVAIKPQDNGENIDLICKFSGNCINWHNTGQPCIGLNTTKSNLRETLQTKVTGFKLGDILVA